MEQESSIAKGRQPGDATLITLNDLSKVARKREIIDVSPVVLRRWCVDGVTSQRDSLPISLKNQKVGSWYRSSVNFLREFLDSQVAEQ